MNEDQNPESPLAAAVRPLVDSMVELTNDLIADEVNPLKERIAEIEKRLSKLEAYVEKES